MFSNIKSKDEKTVIVSLHNQDEQDRENEEVEKEMRLAVAKQSEEVKLLTRKLTVEVNSVFTNLDVLQSSSKMSLNSKKQNNNALNRST